MLRNVSHIGKPIAKAIGALFKAKTLDKGRVASRNNSNRMPAGHAETSKHSTKQKWSCEPLQSNWRVLLKGAYSAKK